MEVVTQTLDDLVASLSRLETVVEDPLELHVVGKLRTFPVRKTYAAADVVNLLSDDFAAGFLCVQLFLGISRDDLASRLSELLGPGGIGKTRFIRDQPGFVAALGKLGLLEAMTIATNTKPVWSDLLVERLRGGRGRAIRGQQRGRWLEDFTEDIVKSVFAERYENPLSVLRRPKVDREVRFRDTRPTSSADSD